MWLNRIPSLTYISFFRRLHVRNKKDYFIKVLRMLCGRPILWFPKPVIWNLKKKCLEKDYTNGPGFTHFLFGTLLHFHSVMGNTSDISTIHDMIVVKQRN
ncbi:hypothetical protein CEXT_89851 [Caerostris extrusa]|uniref:Uncharacterized protein n=1 Tax=Caerostris extrusa TaxID=172846 RepID=A0AAV4QTK7_CAEEX|nr:hypothetical protein CEXT_89851 [Caerostris extrusa]